MKISCPLCRGGTIQLHAYHQETLFGPPIPDGVVVTDQTCDCVVSNMALLLAMDDEIGAQYDTHLERQFQELRDGER